MKRISLFILLVIAAVNSCGAKVYITKIINNTNSRISVASMNRLNAEMIYSNDGHAQDYLTKPTYTSWTDYYGPSNLIKREIYLVSLAGNGYSMSLSGIPVPQTTNGLGLQNSLILVREQQPFALLGENNNYIEKKNLFNNPANEISRISEEKIIDGESYTLEIYEPFNRPTVSVPWNGDNRNIPEGRYQIVIKKNDVN